jgi:hypothetical protein
MENADRLFPRVIARSLVDHGQSHEIDHDEIDYEAAISTPGLPRHCCPVERVRSRRQPDGFLVMTQMETLLPSSQTPGPWKSPLERGGSRYSQIDDNYSQIDYIWETGGVAAFAPAPALRSAGATHPVPPGWCRAGHPSQEGIFAWATLLRRSCQAARARSPRQLVDLMRSTNGFLVMTRLGRLLPSSPSTKYQAPNSQ